MTHQPPAAYWPPAMPPPAQWPITSPPDCPTCRVPAQVVWIGPATTKNGDAVNVWHCHSCRAAWYIRITRWPVNDGPDCPYCPPAGVAGGPAATSWLMLDPDQAGDLWICGNAHEFTLTADGLIVPPTNPPPP